MSKNFWTEQSRHENRFRSDCYKALVTYETVQKELKEVEELSFDIHPSVKLKEGVELTEETAASIQHNKDVSERKAPLYHSVRFEIPTGPKTVKTVYVGGQNG